MLQHEPQEPTVPNAAQVRVTPEELNAALKTLEDRQNSTVAIGSVVEELRLNATPEQIWEQVQKQREQDQQAPKPAVFAQPNTPARRRLRTWRGIKGWVWVLFWCSGGLGLLSGVAHLVHPAAAISGQLVTIDGDETKMPISVQGKDVVIAGDDDTITLRGKARSVTVSGDNAHLRGDEPGSFVSTGDRTDAQWTAAKPHPVAPRPPSPRARRGLGARALLRLPLLSEGEGWGKVLLG